MLVEAKGQCYYTVTGGRGAPASPSRCCEEPLMRKVLRCTKTGFGTETEDLVYSRIFTASIGHVFSLGMKENSPIFESFFYDYSTKLHVTL